MLSVIKIFTLEMLIIKNTSAKNSIFAPHAANFKNLFDSVQEMGRPKFKYSFTLISSGDTSNHSRLNAFSGSKTLYS